MEETESAIAEDEIVSAAFFAGTAYVLEKDRRKCMSPRCGGFWVEAVNRRSTRCADGTYADRCYVAEADWDVLGLSPAQERKLVAKAGARQAVILGRIVPRVFRGFGNLGALVPRKAWQAATDVPFRGRFYRVKDLGIRCVTAPCFSMRADLLNTFRRYRISGLDLSRPGANRHQIYEARQAARRGDLLVAGAIRHDPRTTDRRRIRRGRTLHASQFYLPVVARQCTVDADCTASRYHHPVETQADCHCLLCPAPIGVRQAAENRTNWQRMCPPVTVGCPLPPCAAPPPVGCVQNECQYVH